MRFYKIGGRWIDLDHVIAISDAKETDSGFKFQIHFMFKDEPIEFFIGYSLKDTWASVSHLKMPRQPAYHDEKWWELQTKYNAELELFTKEKRKILDPEYIKLYAEYKKLLAQMNIIDRE